MTLISKQVYITLANNIKRYEDLGYEIPRYLDNQGKMSVKKGTKVLINIEDVPSGSKVLVEFLCDYCNGENQTSVESKFKPYYKYLQSRLNIPKDACFNTGCTNEKSVESRCSKPLQIHESAGGHSPHLVSEWSEKNDRTIFEHRYGSEKFAWWICPDCDSEYDMRINTRTTKNCKCPYCQGYRVNETNCLSTTHPEVANMLQNSEMGAHLSSGMNRKVDFKCLECNYSEPKIVQTVVKQGFSCPRCSDGYSYPEKFITSMLAQLNVKVERQKVFEWSKIVISDNMSTLNGIKRYDFYLPDLNYIIETHGEQHYVHKRRQFKRNFKEEQENDKLKEKYALLNGIEKYIVLDCSKSNLNYIKNKIYNSALNNMLNLDAVDWKSCHSYATSSLVVKVSSLWDEFNNVSELAKHLDLDNTTTRRYLLQGKELGLCSYDPKLIAIETRQNNLMKAIETRSVKVIQLSRSGDFIKEWKNASEASRQLGINNIPTVCRGRQKTAGGFKWMYKSEHVIDNRP